MDLYWDEVENGGVLYVSCTDITELKKKQQEIRDNYTMYKLTTQQANINLWTYNVAKDIMYNTENSFRTHPGDRVITNFINTVMSMGSIRKDSIADFLNIYDRLKNGEKTISKDIWIRKKDNSGWWCERITYSNILDEDGKSVKAFGIGRDVTEFKQAEQKILEEKEFQSKIESEKLLLKSRCNISINKVESLQSSKQLKILEKEKDYDCFVDNLCQNIFSDKEKVCVKNMLAREKIIETAGDKKLYSFEYRRVDKQGYPVWVSVTVKALTRLESNEIIAFIYMYDINREKNMELIINKVIQDDYEVLALIYTDIDRMSSIYIADQKGNMRINDEKNYTKAINIFVEDFINEEQCKQAKAAFSIKNLKQKLETNNFHEISFGVKGEEGKHYQKKWRFYYFDDSKNCIIYTRADITEIFREQEQQHTILTDALVQAEEASKAKTNFLSRMSHEIRTPMNAIIGMTALAIQNMENKEQIADCLCKVGISARFLLSLINDILDMSRIESGKMTIKKQKFQLEDLVNDVNAIFYEQAEQNGLDYDCVISSYVSPYYFADFTKLQQIIVNLLGNSIKFTSSGGKVQLIINQDQVINGKSNLTITVNDTGMGIHQDMLDKIFEPFEQVDTSITTPYKGTGLGLAITKNLVNMMGGIINVNSIVDAGSEFLVRIPIEVIENNEYPKFNIDIPLEKINTLIVDDDIIICEHTKLLLKDMGIRAEWVESGYSAIELIKSRWKKKQYFDVVLLDWKMPDMDGIETARQIRKIVGDNITIIVMTAYDWADIEEDAKKAGVNLMVTKPLFKSSLISVFKSAFQKKDQKKQVKDPVEYNFKGIRILLVEDHILNVEVAKRLLEAKNAEIVVAQNGLRAIEIFMEKENNYFDAILMDIRMPVMDGLTASKTIRQLRKTGAKSVPIIAMSANAFEDDIEKSKSVGINEHLSKPIEPNILYSVLNKWIKKNH